MRMRRRYFAIPVWVVFALLLEPAHAWSKDGFVDSVLDQYKQTDQAGRADTARDGVITEGEFVFSLYGQADARGNNDKQVSREEFLDYYHQLYNISSELGTVMFDYLNDPASRDDVITASDVSLTSFAGRTYATVAEYKEGLEKWLRQSLEKLYSILMSPHVISTERELSINFGSILTSVDTNNDDKISVSEISHELKRFNPNQPASRTDWVWRNSKRYGVKHPDVASLAFDFYDRDRDLKLTARDLRPVAESLDYDGNGQIEKEEALRFWERAYTLSQRMTGHPITLPMIRCPQPWWSKFESMPSMDAMRAAMDMDDDLDGWVTASDLRRWLDIFGTDDAGELDKSQYVAFTMDRYKTNSTIANTMFELADTNGDQKLSEKDWEFHFKDGFAVSLCDARRSLLDLARMASKFQRRQVSGQRLRDQMQRKIQNEWRMYQQGGGRGRGGGGGGWRPGGMFGSQGFGGGRGWSSKVEMYTGSCPDENTCYTGEYTRSWGSPGAWLWWGPSTRSGGYKLSGGGSPGGPFSGGDMSGGGFPGSGSSLGGGGMPPGPFFPGQGGFMPGGTSAGGDMMPQMFPFKREAEESEARKRRKHNDDTFFHHYQRLLSPFAPARDGIRDSITKNSADNQPTTNNFLPPQVEREKPLPQPPSSATEGSPFRPIVSNIQDTASRSQEFVTPEGTARTLTGSPSDAGVAEKSDVSGPGQLEGGKSEPDMGQQFPLMGYPVFVGIDPWFYGGGPSWGFIGRMKRKENEVKAEADSKEAMGIVDSAEEDDAEDLKRRKRAAESGNQKEANQAEESMMNANETDFHFEDFVKGKWPGMDDHDGPPPNFGISPWDLWAAMMVERAMMDPEHWNSTDSQFDANSTEETLDGKHWPLGPWAYPPFGPMHLPHDEGDDHDEAGSNMEGGKSREKRNAWPWRPYGYYNNPYYWMWWMRMRMMSRMMYQYYPNYQYRQWMGSYPYRRWQWYPYSTSGQSPNWMSNYNMWRRNTEVEEDEAEKRPKRDAEDGSNRAKRWYGQNWNWNWPNQRSSNYNYRYGWPNNWHNSWGNYGYGGGFYKRETEDEEAGRSKREADDGERVKRWWNPRFNGWYGWNRGMPGNWRWWSRWGRMWKRGAEGDVSDARYRRDVDDDDQRIKRWQGGSWGYPGYYWNNWQRYSWGPYNRWNMWKREVQENGKESMSKREVNTGEREKRWEGQWNYWPQHSNFYGGWQGNNDWSYNNMGYFMWKRDASDDESSGNTKRDTAALKTKRWLGNNWFPWQNGYGGQWWNMYQPWKAFRNIQQWFNGMGKREIEENEPQSREKRDTEDVSREKRWQGQMMNQWPWYYNYYGYSYWPRNYMWNRWNNNRFNRNMWKRETGTDGSDDRLRRDADESGREKRWQNSWYPRQSSYNWRWSSPWRNNYRYGNNHWNRWSNDMWKRDSEKEPSEDRPKRSADESSIEKRWMQGNWYPWQQYSGQWYYPMWNNWQGWSNNMWKRASDSAESRPKRDSEDSDREKRWMQGNWYPWQQYNNWQWSYPWWNNRQGWSNNMWKRESETEGVESRPKRDAEDSEREKRWMQGNWYPWQQYNNWQWNHPWWNNWSSNMWKRQSETNTAESRPKRDAEDSDREKRWMQGNWYPWQQYSGQWSYPMWNNWQGWSNMWKRASEDEESRPKRDAEENDREKRWMQGNWYPWQYSNNWSWNNYQFRSPYNRWYNMYNMWKREAQDESSSTRTKREVNNNDREKRWQGMGWNSYPSYWNQWSRNSWSGNNNYNSNWRWNQNYQNQWQNNWWKREVDDGGERVKRDVNEVREKRWQNYGGHPWQNFNNWQWSYPRYSSYGNSYNNWQGMNNMWKRDMDTDKDKIEGSRDKRSVEDVGREKRWMGNNWNWWPFYWNQWPGYFNMNFYNWPWSQSYMNRWFPGRMWKRQAEVEDTRNKRDTSTQREKRWMQGNWGWNYPRYNNFWNSYPYNWQGWSNRMWKRDSQEKSENSRPKRDAEDTDREKRWMQGNWYPWQQYNNWQWSYPWGNNWQGWSNNMWKRDSETYSTESRPKRDADDSEREKRWMQGNWYPWQWSYPMWNNWQGWSNNMWKRASESESTEGRIKRDADNNEREKRWMQGNWYPWQQYYNWQWGYPWSSMRHGWSNSMWKRESEKSDTESVVARSKREAEGDARDKRWMQGNWYPWQQYNNWQWWNNRYRWSNNMWKRASESESTEGRIKRDADNSEREKRWMQGNWYPWQQYGGQWSYPMWNTWQGWSNNMWKRESESAESRPKRDVDNSERDKRWMQGNWYPWRQYNNWQWSYPGWNNRYQWSNNMWKRDSQTESAESRSKRDTEHTDREKRWMQGSWYPWQQYGGQWSYPMWNNWQGWSNNMWKRESEIESTEGRTKRDADNSEREKRWMQGNWYPWQQYNNWQWSYPWWSMRQGGSNNMWKRDSEIEATEARTKRDVEDSAREKRWMQGNWYPWRQYNNWQWSYPGWNNRYQWSNNMWKRDSQTESAESRSKRDTEHNDREKRWMQGSWYPWQQYGGQWSYPMWNNWQGWSNNMWKRESEIESTGGRTKRDADNSEREKRWMQGNWYPWQQYNNWQWSYPWWSMRQGGSNNIWKRDSEIEATEARTKRDVEDSAREKRWMQGNWYPWRQYNNWQWSYPGWNYRYQSSNNMWKRDSQTESAESRSKRDTEHNDREKRWMQGSWYPWQQYGGQWSYPMWNNWQGWSNNMWKRESEIESTEGRTKRDADNSEREKRWMQGNWYPWQQYNNWQWSYPWWSMRQGGSNNMWKRDSEIEATEARTKRDVEDSARGKRWMQGNWYPWYNNYWNSYPYSWRSWSNRMWKRDSQEESVEAKTKRDAEDTDREKRWMQGNWYPWQQYNNWHRSYPWGNNWNGWSNNMWKRESKTSDSESAVPRTKRAAEDNKREKRWMQGNWYPWQWSYPMWNNWQGWSNNMWKRESESAESRPKRDAEDSDREKRWMQGNWYPSQYSNNWQWNYPWYNRHYGNFYNNWQRWSYNMWKREAQDNTEESRAKRDVESAGRERRWQGSGQRNWGQWPWSSRFYGNNWPWSQSYMNNWPRQWSSGQMWRRETDADEIRVKRDTTNEREKRWQQGSWYPWQHSNNWQWSYPMWNNWQGWSNNMWKRDSESESAENRPKRDAEDNDREKRWMQGNWYPWQYYNNWQWNYPQWNNWRGWSNNMWKRESTTDDEVTETRQKRDADEGSREKRWQQGIWSPRQYSNNWQWKYPWWNNQYGNMYGNWNQWSNSNMWKRDSKVEIEDSRAKRDTEDNIRDKRWMQGNWYPWQYQNNWQWSYPMRGNWQGWSNNMWKRESENSELKTGETRTKRNAGDNDRDKRWMQGNWYPWQYYNNWQWSYPMRNNWRGWSNNMWKRDLDVDSNVSRPKRNAEGTDREKRWMQGNWGWNYPWYNNYGNSYPYSWRGWSNRMWKRGSQEESVEAKTKRDAEDTDREKRWMQGNWYPWQQFNNWQWSYPWGNNWHGWSNNMWKRDSETDSTESRPKRDADDSEREKRWMQGNWYPWQQYNNWQWSYPWGNNWQGWSNNMWKRDSETESTESRPKRDADDSDREKRWMQGNWYPWQQYNNWQWSYPWGNNWQGWSNNMWKRDSETESTESRPKRDADDSDREKRWMQGNWYPWQQPWWNQYNYGSNWQSWFNRMWKRNSDDASDETHNSGREKRWLGSGWGYRPFNWGQWPWSFYNRFWPWRQFYMSSWYNRWLPGQMWKRGTQEDARAKRSAGDETQAERDKRWGNNNWYPCQYNCGWSNQWNSYQNWRPYSGWSRWRNNNNYWKRDETSADTSARAKREVNEVERSKRWQGSGWNWPWYQRYGGGYNWPHRWNRGWWQRGMNMWKRGADGTDQKTRTKRDTTDAREKRWMGQNYWSPWQYSNGGRWSNNFMNNYQGNWFNSYMWKRDAQDESEAKSVEKREADKNVRNKRWFRMSRYPGYGRMYNNWQWSYPWWNMYRFYWNQWWPRYYRFYGSGYRPWGRGYMFPRWNRNMMNFMWKRDAGDTEEDQSQNRLKRDTESVREKRWQGNNWFPQNGNWQWGSPRWNNYQYWGQNMQRWSSNTWKRETDDDAEHTRTKRDTEDVGREKRWMGGMWNSRYNWFNWPWYFNYYYYRNWPWNQAFMNRWRSYWPYAFGGMYRWKRGAELEDSEPSEREKRWQGYNWVNPMWNRNQYWNPQNNWQSNNWMWKRGAEEDSETPRVRRDTEDNGREKRWQGNSWYPRQYGWNNGQWSNPGYWNRYNGGMGWSNNWNMGNNMWKRGASDEENNGRVKRSSGEADREKRWGRGMFMSTSQNWENRQMWRAPNWNNNDQWMGRDWYNGRMKRSPDKFDGEMLDSDKRSLHMQSQDRITDQEKREYSYGKKGSSSSSSNRKNDESVWRSAKKDQNRQGSWQQQMNRGNPNWRHSNNKNFGFNANNRWMNGQMRQGSRNFQSNRNNWIGKMRPGGGGGESWQNYGQSTGFPGSNTGNSMGQGFTGMPVMSSQGRNSAWQQPHSNQWQGGFDRNQGGPGYGWQQQQHQSMPMGNNFPQPSFSGGMGGFDPSFMGGRYFRAAQDAGDSEETSTINDANNDEGVTRKKREVDDDGETEKVREKRWWRNYGGSFSSNPMYSRYYGNMGMRQMWAPWFYYSFCQRSPWMSQYMMRFKRNATDTDEADLYASWMETEDDKSDPDKEKRQDQSYQYNPYQGNRGGYQNWYGYQNRNQMWNFYRWMCPQVWNWMQMMYMNSGRFQPWFYQNRNFWNSNWNPRFNNFFQRYWSQNRWKRSAVGDEDDGISERSEGSITGEDARDKRQWQNPWQQRRMGSGGFRPEDCEEWMSPMPAWSPWRGWNMLRKTRSSEDNGNDESSSENDLKARRGTNFRCRSWNTRGYNRNMMHNPGMRSSNNQMGFGGQFQPSSNNWMGNRGQYGDNFRGYGRQSRESADHGQDNRVRRSADDEGRDKRSWMMPQWNSGWPGQSWGRWPNMWGGSGSYMWGQMRYPRKVENEDSSQL